VRRVLLVNWEKCIGCRSCKMICSLVNEGRCNPAEARISVVKFEAKGLNLPIFCQNCEEPLCEAVCPQKAVYKDNSTGQVLVDTKRCIGCRMCILACPIGGPSFHPVKREVIKCDLCSGEFICAKYCPEGALEMVNFDTIGARKRRENIRRLSSYVSMIMGEKE